MAAAVESVRIAPAKITGCIRWNGFFSIKEREPHAVSGKFFSAKLVRNGEKKSGTGSTVIRADKARVAQRIIGIDMGAEHDDPIPRAREFRDDVPHPDRAGRRLREKNIILYMVSL